MTIIHGEPTDLAEAEALNEFYAEVTGICDVAEWSRLAGRVDHLTVTIAAVDRDKYLRRVADATRLSPWLAQ